MRESNLVVICCRGTATYNEVIACNGLTLCPLFKALEKFRRATKAADRRISMVVAVDNATGRYSQTIYDNIAIDNNAVKRARCDAPWIRHGAGQV